MISEALKHLRQREDITQAELANDFGITQQAVARWEQDKSDQDKFYAQESPELYYLRLKSSRYICNTKIVELLSKVEG